MNPCVVIEVEDWRKVTPALTTEKSRRSSPRKNGQARQDMTIRDAGKRVAFEDPLTETLTSQFEVANMAPWLLSAAVALLQLLPETAVAQDVASPFTKASNDSLLWGPYRPNLYFGVRPRLPKSVLTGLLWAKVEDFASVQNSAQYVP